MTFLNPWMLLGALAVGIPIAMHFFYRARYRPLEWGAMKFLRMSIEQTSRRLRFQEVLLLLLRILVCLILALALARPASEAITSGDARGESVDAILVVDTSYSMSAMEDGKSRLDRAKDAAIKVIDNLPPNSTVQVIGCADRSTHLGPKTPTNLDQARHLIRNIKTASLSSDFIAGFAEAYASFEKTSGSNKEVYFFSDMQRSGWERQATAIRSKCEEIKNQGTLYLVRCSEKDVKNVAIVGIVPQTEIPHKGARISFTVLLRNSSSEPVTNLNLSLQVDGQDFDKDAVTVDKVGPGETRAVTITGKIDLAGWRLLTARIKDDDIEEDNEFSRIILVHEKIRVLVVDGMPDDREPSKAGTYFLGHALLPIPEERKGTYHLTAAIVRPEGASAGSLVDQDICILANVGASRLKPDFVEALDAFVRSGKGLFISSGFNVVPKEYNETLGNLLPVPLLDEEPYLAPKDSPLFPALDSVDPQSFLSKFNEGGRNPLKDLQVAFTLAVLPVVDPKTAANKKDLGRVLLRYNDGRPMLLSKNIGGGEVMLLTTTVDPTWSYLFTVPPFAPFINGCMAHLIQRSSGPYNRVAGEPIKWVPYDLQKDYFVITPDGDKVPLGRPKEFEGQIRLPVFDTKKAGLYQIIAAGDTQGERFALTPDLRETENLEALPDEQIDDQLGFKPIHLSTNFDGSTFNGKERSRKEWTIWVLVVLLLFAFGEAIWAWFCGKAW